MWLGEFDVNSVVHLKFCTVSTTGAPTQLAGTPAISIYKGNSVTQSTTGVTLTVDFDAVTGLNHVAIDTSTDGTFYATANDFQVVITTGTVGGTSVVGYVVGHFSIRNRASLYPTTAARTLDVSAGGEAGVDWANVGSPTTTVSLTNTTVATVTTTTTATNVTTVNGLAAGVITAAAIADGAIDRATFAADTGLQSANSDTLQSATASTAVLATGALAVNSYYNDQNLYLTGGTGAGQCRRISAYTGSTRSATITPNWNTTPDGTTTYAVLPFPRTFVSTVGSTAITAASFTAGSLDAAALAADAGTEIGTAVWASAARTLTAATNITSDGGIITVASGVASANAVQISGDATAANNLEAMLDGTGGVSLTLSTLTATTNAIAWNASWDAEVQSEVEDGLNNLGYTTTVSGRIDAAITTRLAPTNAGRTLTVDTDGMVGANNLAIAKNTALANFEFPLFSSSDHVTPTAGLTVTAQRSIDGGAFASCVNAVSEVSNGVYKISLAASDLNGDVITLRFTATGADAQLFTLVTQAT